jgi:hypothetical protein
LEGAQEEVKTEQKNANELRSYKEYRREERGEKEEKIREAASVPLSLLFTKASLHNILTFPNDCSLEDL